MSTSAPTSSRSAQRPSRTSVKESSSASLRQSMNRRRHDLSQKIRKTKKSHQLQLKRRHTSASTPITSQNSTYPPAVGGTNANQGQSQLPSECLQQFLSSPSIFTLTALQTILSCTSSGHNSSLPLHEIPSAQGQAFLSHLTTFLTSIGAENANHEVVLQSLRVLTNLAAMECPDTYYTSSKSWCNFILSSSIPVALLPLLSSHDAMVQEQACWVVGNIAGDSQQCRDRLIELNFIPTLVAAMNPDPTSANENSSRENAYIGVRRNVTWALSNMARGHKTALPFIQGGLGTANILQMLNMEEESSASGSSSNVEIWDVRKQLYWLLSFLTCKEEDALEHLMSDELFLVLSRHLAFVTATIIETRNRSSIFQSVIPLIRIIGNLATAADGKYVPGIITTNSNSVVHSCARWLQVHKPCGETMTIATEVTWVAGALLCDVGYPQHPSTMTACPVLLPALCNVLISGTFTLEWKREVLNATWNALAAPPGSSGDDTLEVRDRLLFDIYKTKGMVRSMVGLLVCMDVDAIRPALNILDAFHRRMGRFDGNAHRILDEAECLHALENVCDKASESVSYGEGTDWSVAGYSGGMDYCAEMAANLIDDFYCGENEDDEVLVVGNSSSSMDGFNFGITEPVPVFDFGGNSNSNNMNLNAAQVPRTPPRSSGVKLLDPMTSPTGRGRGRGRGRVLPAWMQQKR